MTDSKTIPTSRRPAAPRGIVDYNYRGGSEFEPGTVEELEGLHKAFCRELPRQLSQLLQVPTTISLRTVDEVPYSSYFRSLPSPTVLGVVGMAPTQGRALVDLPNHLGFAILDILLGGPGRPTAFRAFTDLEGALLTMALKPVVESIAGTFSTVVTLNPEILAVQAHPSIASMLDPDEPTLVMSFDIRIETAEPTEGVLSICYPKSTLTSLLTATVEEEIEIAVQDPVNPELFDPLSAVDIAVTARLKASPISLLELSELQPGDVVVLSHKATEPVTISAGGHDLLEGHVGQYNNNLALSITKWTV